MSNYLRETVLSGWNVKRFMGLGAGFFIAAKAIIMKDSMLGFFSAFILFQVLANIGCFGSAGCAAPQNYNVGENTPDLSNEIEILEVKK